MAHYRMRFAAVAAAVAVLPSAIACSSANSANDPRAQLTDLNVAVVPAVDSAGFFIALYDGLFRAHGLSVHFIPAVSSQTEIDLQAEQLPTGNPLDISCGAYPSYIQGFPVCSVADADKLTDWLAAHVAHAEQNPDQVREELLRHCREEKIEPRNASMPGSAAASSKSWRSPGRGRPSRRAASSRAAWRHDKRQAAGGPETPHRRSRVITCVIWQVWRDGAA